MILVKAKRKPGRPKGAKNKTTLIAERLVKAGIKRGPSLVINPKRLRLAEKRINDLLRDKNRNLSANQILFAAQLVALLNGLEIPMGLTSWERRVIRDLIEDRELLQRLKRTAEDTDEDLNVLEREAQEQEQEQRERSARAAEDARAFLERVRQQETTQEIE